MPPVSEVDLTMPDFPVVRARAVTVQTVETAASDLSEVLSELSIVADHPRMRAALNVAAALAPSSAPVLILGASGTGKELVAKLIHRLSGRPREVFVLALNCAAVPKELAESVLFGHRKG
jgi:DNA-binding NtrC family response regulator